MASSYMSQFQMTGTNLFSTYASLTGMLMLVRSMFNDLIPHELRGYLVKVFHYIFKKTSLDRLTLVVDERIGYNNNHVYEAAEAYLRTIINPAVDRLKVSKTQRQKKFTISIEKGEEILDTYQGMKITWKYVFEESDKESSAHISAGRLQPSESSGLPKLFRTGRLNPKPNSLPAGSKGQKVEDSIGASSAGRLNFKPKYQPAGSPSVQDFGLVS